MELNDIQGLLARGHGDLPYSSYLFARIIAPADFPQWLQTHLPKITPADQKPPHERVQIAFTYPGLSKLGVENAVGFRPDFIQGMATEYRARVLGDLGESCRENWDWGGPTTPEIDLVILLFADSESDRAALETSWKATFPGGGLEFIHQIESALNPHEKEHFGFRDGVSQPILPGLKKMGLPENTVPEGEFILGYKNAYDEFPDSPLVHADFDPTDQLPAGESGWKDFGRNGSYMVFRQLRQDVHGFWQFLLQAVKIENPDADVAECIALAAKMVGRWPSGAPLSTCPHADEPDRGKDNDFLYGDIDRDGLSCPLGSHIRRSYPRDTLPDNKPASSVKISNRHRILRRGRNFGPPLSPTFDPTEMLRLPDDGQSRGLNFICFNTNIAQQFEFIQHTWNDNTKFGGLYDDPDPILGIKDSRDKSETHDFTIQASPVRRKIRNMQRFVHMMGGAYFFMPGMSALAYLAHPSAQNH